MAMEATGGGEGQYDAGSIQVLKGLEAVRKRPSMYIGSTGETGLHHLVYEVVDNSIDEALAGFCDDIRVTVHTDNSISVEDNGRGIPVDMHPTEKLPAVEVALTVLHAGGKFDKSNYKVSGGLHGVGVSVVNALSERTEVIVKRDGHKWRMAFVRGQTVKKLEKLDKAKDTGTMVRFKPDPEIFSVLEYSYSTLADRLRELAFLNKGVTHHPEGRPGEEPKVEEFFAKGGLIQFVEWLNRNKKALHPKPIAFYRDQGRRRGGHRPPVRTTATTRTSSPSSTTSTPTRAGTHLTGFRAALTRTINEYAKQQGSAQEGGLHAHRGRRPRGPDRVLQRARCTNRSSRGRPRPSWATREVEGIVKQVVNEQLRTFLEENPAVGAAIIEKAVSAARAREAARKARDLVRKKSGLEGAVLPGKLADCSADDPGAVRALPRGGRLRRRQRQAGPGPAVPGDPAAARQDPQRGEGPDRQDPLQRGDPDDDHGHRGRHRGMISSSTTRATTRSSS